MGTNNVIDMFTYQRINMDKAREDFKRLKNGGGGGIHDGMEARVAKLENQFDKMNDLLIRIDERTKSLATKEDVATIKTELKTKIGWPALATAAGIIIAALSAVITLF